MWHIESSSDVRVKHLILDFADSHVVGEHRIRFATKDSEIMTVKMNRMRHGVETIRTDLTVLNTQ